MVLLSRPLSFFITELIKKGSIAKKPITGGSKGLPPLKKEKKKVIKKKIKRSGYSFLYFK